jgi:hypothetical protein
MPVSIIRIIIFCCHEKELSDGFWPTPTGGKSALLDTIGTERVRLDALFDRVPDLEPWVKS